MITVVGGTYREINYDSISHEIFGSGFRASKFLLENNCDVNYVTYGNEDTISYLKENKKVYPRLNFRCFTSSELITFKYSFSLDNPTIFPNLFNIVKSESINVNEDNIVCFGILEAEFKIKGKKVVYDPQTGIQPRKFSAFGKTEELVYIVNKSEAESISGSKNINDIKAFFFEQEKACAIIIKNGPHGAKLYYEQYEFDIPSYITNNVHKIGSGDIFTGSFAYYWLEKNLPLEKCALYASLSTAYFCDIQAYVDTSLIENKPYKEHTFSDLSGKQVYLAAPFFSLAELILIDKIRTAFIDFGVKVFSPFHDIGFGDDESIARKDIKGLMKSDIIFCVFDNLDSGTLIESGFALAHDKKIIGYQRTCQNNHLLMLKPADIKLYDNLTSAIYNTIWSL
ncbi:PfkB family carbohydrate kinase [uncultured Sphingobacterium sp.]|uniref:PfkB family carbohydrate kinase n=1 Tax=uncultured Sphingobacterium sp. TaxID=182688 RepID=UPI0025CF39CD|nr:PfkB family carbohydrate kinase [uncultured Sphingobacterium sp.]